MVVVSRVVPDADLDSTALEIAHAIAKSPPFAVKLFRRTLAGMANTLPQASLAEEAVAQSLVFASADYAEMRAARAEGRDPEFRNR